MTEDIALMLVRRWSGLREYPRRAEGEMRLAEDLIAATRWRLNGGPPDANWSRRFAEGLVLVFLEYCPTPRQVYAQAALMRPKYEPPQPDIVEQWRAECGEPDPAFSQSLIASAVSGSPDFWEKDRRMWQAIRKHLGIKQLRPFSDDRKVAQAKQELGFELNRWDEIQLGLRSWPGY